MSRIQFEKKYDELMDYIRIEHKLPKVWEEQFSDNSDMRLWFNKLYSNNLYKEYCLNIVNILNKYGFKILSDKEKENEFIEYIKKYDEIPSYNNAFFSDNSDMANWYLKYKNNNDEFETNVHNLLSEYNEFDLSCVLFYAKEEFFEVVNKLKRIPSHGEVYTQNGIDIRVIFDKLSDYEPELAENLLIELSSFSKNKLNIKDRKNQYLDYIRNMGSTPWLQECRFSDGVDMYTWYEKYKNRIDGFEEEVNELISKKKVSKVNLYLLYDSLEDGNISYTICTNEGIELNLDFISNFNEAKDKYPELCERGKIILKENEQIQKVKIKTKKK